MMAAAAESKTPTMTSHRDLDLFAPTPEHALLGETLETFVAREVEPQAAEHDRSETFNHALFRRAGELGLLGITLPEEYGGAVSSFGWNLGPLELTVADEFVYYAGVPLGTIRGVRIETELDRWITRNGIKLALYPPGIDWLCLEGGASLMHFLGTGAKVDSTASPLAGVVLMPFSGIRLRIGWESDLAEHDYAAHIGRVDLGFTF